METVKSPDLASPLRDPTWRCWGANINIMLFVLDQSCCVGLVCHFAQRNRLSAVSHTGSLVLFYLSKRE